MFRVGQAGYWRGVNVAFACDDAGNLHRLEVQDEGWELYDLISCGADRCLILHDTMFRDQNAVALEQWDLAAGTRKLTLVPKGMFWGKIALSPDRKNFAVAGWAWNGTSYVVKGAWDGPVAIAKFHKPDDADRIGIWDIDDDGRLIIWRWAATSPEMAELHLLPDGVTQTQWIGQADPQEFPCLKAHPNFGPVVTQERRLAEADMISAKDLPSSSDASRMMTTWPVAMKESRIPPTLSDAKFGAAN